MDQRGNVHPPIFIIEGNDVSAYSSLQQAEQQVESPDVDEYEIYDSEGRRLTFGPKTEPRGRWIKTVQVVPVQLVAVDDDPSHRKQLRGALLRYLEAIGRLPSNTDEVTLEELVLRAKATAG